MGACSLAVLVKSMGFVRLEKVLIWQLLWVIDYPGIDLGPEYGLDGGDELLPLSSRRSRYF